MTPTEVAEQRGRALLARFVRDQMTDTEIAQTLRMTRWRIAPTGRADVTRSPSPLSCSLNHERTHRWICPEFATSAP